VPATRIYSIAAALLALLALAVTLVLATDRVAVIVDSMFTAVLWAAVVILVQSRSAKKLAPPLRVGSDELPPTDSLRNAGVRYIAGVVILDAAAVAYSLSFHQYIPVGIILGLPIVIWDSHRKAKRTELELRGTLWAINNFAGTPKSHPRYLVART